MNAEQLNRLLQQNDLLAQTRSDELLQLTHEFPWFGTAQVLSAIKLQQQKDEQAEMQIQKALLYVQHPLYLQTLSDQFNPFANKTDLTFLGASEINEDVVLNAATTVEAADSLITTADNDIDATLDASAMIEATDSIITTIDEETEASINAEALIEASAQTDQTGFKPLSDLLKQPLKEGEDKLAFEPLHTVDYFASQGIKLKEEQLQKDELGKQLKTFTQWLKTMKKVYVEEHKQLDAVAEKEVLQKAVESNTEEEIITEAMAQVLEQQGKTGKAIELYRKLSLLHPEKSPYFAARIERLNN